jgi:hypothetical protein
MPRSAFGGIGGIEKILLAGSAEWIISTSDWLPDFRIRTRT